VSTRISELGTLTVREDEEECVTTWSSAWSPEPHMYCVFPNHCLGSRRSRSAKLMERGSEILLRLTQDVLPMCSRMLSLGLQV
jgi:hypothetical protein